MPTYHAPVCCHTETISVCLLSDQGAIGLARGGEQGIFTPMYLCVARKPLTAGKK